MKNLFKSMMLVAVAAMGFTACSKEAVEEVNPAIEKGFSLTISAEKPALESDTRTEFADGSVIWSDGDKVRAAYKHTADGWSKYFASNEAVSEDGYKTATFALNENFEEAVNNGTYTFYAGYPNDKLNGNETDAPVDDAVSVEVLTEQVMPKAGTFDAKADIMVGVSEEYNAWPTEAVALQFHRLVAHGCVTLKNLDAENGEVVKTVTFTAPDGVMLTGNGSVNLVEQTMSKLGNNTVTITLPANTAATENVVVWFCSAPATIASGANLTVTVETTRGTYTRTITANANGIQFLQNRYNTLSIKMDEAVFEAVAVSETVYKQITSMAELTSGEYIIAGKNGTSYYAMNALANSGSKASGSLVIVENDQITENNAEGTIFTLTVSGTHVDIFDGNKYLVYNATSGTNLKLDTGTTNDYWNVSFTDGMFKFLSNKTSSRGLFFRAENYNQFGGYAATNWNNGEYAGLYLFKKTTGEGGETPEPMPTLETPTNLEAIAVGKEVTIAWDEVANATSYYVTCGTQNKTVTEREADFTMDAYSTEYNISVVAKADGYTDSVAATTTVITEADPNAGGDEPGTGEEVTVTFDCSGTNAFSLTGSGTTATLDATVGDISIKITKESSTSNCALYTPLRVYKSHKMTFTSTKNITKIVFNYTDEANRQLDLSVVTGTGEFTRSGAVGTYTGTGETEVALTASEGQVRFKSIEVTYAN